MGVLQSLLYIQYSLCPPFLVIGHPINPWKVLQSASIQQSSTQFNKVGIVYIIFKKTKSLPSKLILGDRGTFQGFKEDQALTPCNTCIQIKKINTIHKVPKPFALHLPKMNPKLPNASFVPQQTHRKLLLIIKCSNNVAMS